MDTIVSTPSTSPATKSLRPRLVIVEEHTAVADVLDFCLWRSFRVRSVIVSRHQSVASIVATAARADIALVASRPGPLIDGEAIMTGLAAAGLPVIALSAVDVEDDPVHWGRCLVAGAVAVLPKSADLADLRQMLGLVLAEQPALSPVLASRLRDTVARAAAEDDRWRARERLGRLTGRERAVLDQLLAGRAPAEIAREDFVAEATVRSQIKSILTKLGVHSQIGAVAVARRAGWQTPVELPAAS